MPTTVPSAGGCSVESTRVTCKSILRSQLKATKLLGASRQGSDTRFPLVAVFLGFYVCRLGFAWLVTFALGLGVVWLWLALVGDYPARSLLKGARFRSGVWKTVAV